MRGALAAPPQPRGTGSSGNGSGIGLYVCNFRSGRNLNGFRVATPVGAKRVADYHGETMFESGCRDHEISAVVTDSGAQ